jgi:aminopeptidase-like protein
MHFFLKYVSASNFSAHIMRVICSLELLIFVCFPSLEDAMHVASLREHQDLLPTLASIYMEEWGWHFSSEWDIVTLEDMIEDLRENYLDATYVAFIDKVFVGTVALLDADLKSHMHLKPWMTCLYVNP